MLSNHLLSRRSLIECSRNSPDYRSALELSRLVNAAAQSDAKEPCGQSIGFSIGKMRDNGN